MGRILGVLRGASAAETLTLRVLPGAKISKFCALRSFGAILSPTITFEFADVHLRLPAGWWRAKSAPPKGQKIGKFGVLTPEPGASWSHSDVISI